MRRIALWLASTVSVLVLLFGYHTSLSGPQAAASDVSVISAASTPSAEASSSKSSTKTKTATPSTVTGDVAQTQWGPVEVQLTVSSGRITDVSVLQYPNGNGRDQEINSYALPTLVQETITAQGSNIDMVSGATVTSTGYLQSLQSALDKANL